MSMFKVIKWAVWAVSIVALLYAGTAILWFGHIITTTVYETPWGKVDTDTAKIGFMELNFHEPCYEVHREIINQDTVRYYFFKARQIYYKADHDSLHNIRIRLYYPHREIKDGEVCTSYFRKEDIFIK